MNTQHLNTPAPPDKERSTWLVAFGVVLLCFGGLCALLTAMMIFMAFAAVTLGPQSAELQGLQAGSMVTGAIIYGALAAWFISMGYGSIRARRWARSLVVATSWLGLVCGGGGTIGMLFFMGDMFKSMEGSGVGQIPPGLGQVMYPVMFATMLTFYVIIPGILLLFYSGRNVKATCEFRNPNPSWTDAVPMPILIQTIVLAFYAVGILSMAGYRFATPFFGMTLTGFPGAIAILSISLCCALLARGCYRLQLMAWWGTVALVLFWGTSAFVTFVWGNIMDFYAAMGMPEVQLATIRPMVEGGAMQTFVLWATPLWLVCILSFFVYTKRYFVGRDEDGGDLH